MAKNREYISLKEAAEISGYSSDYIGQLIRGGKLSGKQVYTNVSWVTTEEALRAYMEDKGRRRDDARPGVLSFFSLDRLERLYATFSWFVIGLLGVFLLCMGYVLAVAVDDRIERTNVETFTYVE